MANWLKLRFRSANVSSTAEVVLYSRTGCHLCDDALEILQRHGLKPQLVDVDSDADLRARFTDCVPVVVIDGRECFRGRVNEVLLRRLLKHRPT